MTYNYFSGSRDDSYSSFEYHQLSTRLHQGSQLSPTLRLLKMKQHDYKDVMDLLSLCGE